MTVNNWQESETLEFKSQWTREALDTVAAFANGRGGVLLVGVKEGGTVIGWQGTEQELRTIADQISETLRIQPSIALETYQNKPVLRIQVSPSRIPVAVRGRYFRRVGNTTREIAPEELGRFFLDTLGLQWDALTGDYHFDEMDSETISHFVHLSRARLPYVGEDEHAQALLQKLNLLHDGKLTNAAVLLFGREPQRRFITATVHIGRFRSDMTIVDDKFIGGNLFRQLDQVMQLFRQYLQVRYDIRVEPESAPTMLEALQRKETWEYPLEALREAVINALIHRDYLSTGDVQIRVYDDQVLITNPGRLPEGLSEAQLKDRSHPSLPRNPLIAQVFYYAGLIERWGTGTWRITELCRDQGLPDPDFVSESFGFRVTFTQDPYIEERLRQIGLNERQIRAVMYVKQEGYISNRQYRELTRVSNKTAYLELNGLVQHGILQVSGSGRSLQYTLKVMQR
jgi:ATP-dependent DNA helicase RecG